MDSIQKCLILNASLNDLYVSNVGGLNSGVMTNNRDINIQAYETSSILQQHHYSTSSSNSNSNSIGNNNINNNNVTSLESGKTPSSFSMCQQQQSSHDNGASGSISSKTAGYQRDSSGNGSMDATEPATPSSKSPLPTSLDAGQVSLFFIHAFIMSHHLKASRLRSKSRRRKRKRVARLSKKN